ncbi:VOC family protein [Cellulomonas terrae]|uniref:Glyoxalase n=1 Tax=Cellulomonas terrae TaxID=311234 RepID=A0A511JJU6_9CELL|nr:VOC family protein [Cellulomonas terrae]GEL98159.1 glyoxalase [Cellulomonas terrae]
MDDQQVAAALYGYLSYQDAPGAIAWLEALGFRVVRRQDGSGGTVQHAELRLDRAVVMVASLDQDDETPGLRDRSVGRGLYLHTDRVDDLYDKALAAGGHPVFPPEDTEWGSRRARVLDPGGHEWSFGTYEPGRAW